MDQFRDWRSRLERWHRFGLCAGESKETCTRRPQHTFVDAEKCHLALNYLVHFRFEGNIIYLTCAPFSRALSPQSTGLNVYWLLIPCGCIFSYYDFLNRRGERILDVGCGDGVLTAEIKARGCKVVGIDFAPDMIAAAVERVRLTLLLEGRLCGFLVLLACGACRLLKHLSWCCQRVS